jgi:hypothetical protein
VSNSSSTSFCLYGRAYSLPYVDSELAGKQLDQRRREEERAFDSLLYEDLGIRAIRHLKPFVDVLPIDEYGDIFIGVHPGELRYEQTGLQFTAEVLARINAVVLYINTRLGWHLPLATKYSISMKGGEWYASGL